MGVFIGGYPDEFEIMHKINSGQEVVMQYSYYVYIGFIIFFSFLGIVKQFRLKKEYEQRQSGARDLENIPKVN